MNIAIIGYGSIAGRFARAAQAHPDVNLVAVAARTPEKVNAFADQYNIPKRCTNMEEVFADPEIDGVYIALPHKLHAEAAVAALNQGKAVLCEKPAVIHPREMEAIMQASASNRTLFMEAMKTRYEPAYRQIKQLVESGQLGEIQSVECTMCSDFGDALNDPSRYFNQPKQGGGLLDGGCYALNYFMDFLPRSYTLESMGARMNADYTADIHVQVELDFEGKRGYLENALDEAKPKNAVITGTRGQLIVENLHRPTDFTWIHEDGTKTTHHYDYLIDDMFPEIDAFYSSWKDGLESDPIMSQEESLAQARLMQRIRGELFGFDPDDHYEDVDEEEDYDEEEDSADDDSELQGFIELSFLPADDSDSSNNSGSSGSGFLA